ncbi:carboxylesterase family protein [Tuwongella immobilis]|uniref:Peptidase S9 prolyl oligopeptidase catalytic domain-containing protein n=1 Tax=Tuwongella immobilis TaxID=692036 RepID=A0A6C2YTM1_9BACT|nr:PHB depolymerase family esterase [Tuwongella immobilis]VIP04232.1 Uncharacterized protein OS=Planctomyces maris DSM 8797 GN=PM8797T_05990 PE=4 SV=1: Esterase_phd [Tuwongella immobilis]VTS05828.1 Uncharacterized protein OS=Planctomyces maris DSM 8797 GN=PM8797T_05990 PE=4 SV=1: Esterase_phd [Tuwongella immobilis]
MIRSSRHLGIRTAFWGLMLVGMVLLALPDSGRADVVILKDGFTLYGKVGKEQTSYVDPVTGESILMAKAGGVNSIDDGCRVTIFSVHTKQIGEVDNPDLRANLVQFRTAFNRRLRRLSMPPDATFSDITPFTKDWRRTVKARFSRGHTTIDQQITIMTPYSVRIDSASHEWAANYLTQELGPEFILPLLKTHPDLAEPDGKANPEKRIKLFRFFLQATWYDLAQKELERLAKDAPDAKDRVEEGQKLLAQAIAERYVEEIEAAKLGGRHRVAQQLINQLPAENVENKLLVRIANLKGTYETSKSQLEQCQRHLSELPLAVSEPNEQFLVGAAKSILMELHLDTLDRLDLFLALADQAERDRKAGKSVIHLPGELLAAAVTGWLQGKNSTETKIPAARRLWRGRDFLLEYLRTGDRRSRDQLLTSYRSRMDALAFDELATMVPLLPPIDAEPLAADAVHTRKTGSLPGWSEGIEYALYLPPEYSPGRAYPLLIAMAHGSEQPDAMITRFRYHASKYGYILVAPKWTPGLGGGYGFSDEEQQSVLGVLQHVRRIAQVDSDRVFLTGVGEGGTLALDVAASHPDLFAGVAPMHPSIEWNRIMVEYWRNLQLVPTYLVTGNFGSDSAKALRRMIEEWMPRGYPGMHVIYKGRAAEWFPAEVPILFDWMNRKKRATAFPECGKPGEEFRALRTGDSRFYWISSDEINEKHTLDNLRPNGIPNPARFSGKAVLGANQINVTAFGVKQVTVWLSREMIDLTKPITIRVNGRLTWNNGNKPVQPDLQVMLEDLYKRGDRQRTYIARVDFDKP